MDLRAAVRAAAHDAPDTAIDGLEAVRDAIAETGALDTPFRIAHLIGQCAHESVRFTRVSESLYYTTAARIRAVWPSRFRDVDHAAEYTRNPEKLANKVYARASLGNTQPGDGYRYRGRGYLQLTGRSNYRIAGRRLGLDLEGDPDLAFEPETAWLIAADYFANRRRARRTAFQWADDNDVETVTYIVNGGDHGLTDRRNRTARALLALGGLSSEPTLRRGDEGESVFLLQRALAAKGFSPGALDGDFGPKTERIVKAFQQAHGLGADGVVGRNTWRALEPLPS